ESLSILMSHATASTHTHTLSLHDALPISAGDPQGLSGRRRGIAEAFHLGSFRRCQWPAGNRHEWLFPPGGKPCASHQVPGQDQRSEEHTSELQSRENLVCRLLLEKQ